MTAPNLHTPSKPINKGAATTGSQRDRRFTDTFFDDYRHPRFPNGRPFCGQREFQSGSETESINAGFLQSDLQCGEYVCDNPEMGQTPEERQRTLASAWVAPWLPPGGKKYMTFNYRRKRITFDYIRGEKDEVNALDQYYLAAANLAAGNGWTEVKKGVIPTFQVTAKMGMPPALLPVWRAARAGDPWLMGAVDEPNERLATILGFGTVRYLGGTDYGDAEYVVVPQAVVVTPVVTPAQILSVPIDEVAAMVDALVAKREAEKKAEHIAKSKAGKEARAKERVA